MPQQTYLWRFRNGYLCLESLACRACQQGSVVIMISFECSWRKEKISLVWLILFMFNILALLKRILVLLFLWLCLCWVLFVTLNLLPLFLRVYWLQSCILTVLQNAMDDIMLCSIGAKKIQSITLQFSSSAMIISAIAFWRLSASSRRVRTRKFVGFLIWYTVSPLLSCCNQLAIATSGGLVQDRDI